jgi:hypothetical protein
VGFGLPHGSRSSAQCLALLSVINFIAKFGAAAADHGVEAIQR